MVLLFSFVLPVLGQGVGVTSVYHPPVLAGMSVHPENPLLFDFIVDRGQENLNDQSLKYESQKLIKYFLASMTIPDPDAWVNLSPGEHDRIMPEALSQTDMGKVMLEQDYLLKQLASSLTNPDQELGQKFWQEVKENTASTQEISQQPLTSFNKVWIVPAGATVVEKDGFAYILNSQLKVMMEEDYALSQLTQKGARKTAGENMSTQVFRKIILPQLEKEVNSGKSFAATRQVYQSVILAAWYKRTLKESLLGKVYADQSKINGITINEKDVKQKIFDQYLETFKKGVYSVIKEESGLDGEIIPRKYFSGGLKLGMMDLNPADDLTIIKASSVLKGAIEDLSRSSKVIVKVTVEEPHAQIPNNDFSASSGLMSNPKEMIRIVERLKFLLQEKKLVGAPKEISEQLPEFFTNPRELAMAQEIILPRMLLAWAYINRQKIDPSTLSEYMLLNLNPLNESNLFKSQIETWFQYAYIFYPGPGVDLSKDRSVPYFMQINDVKVYAIGEFANDPNANSLLSRLIITDDTIHLAKNGQLAIVLDQSFRQKLGQEFWGDPKDIAVRVANLLGIPILFLPISGQLGQPITPDQTLQNIQTGIAQFPHITKAFLIADQAAVGPAASLLKKSASSAMISPASKRLMGALAVSMALHMGFLKWVSFEINESTPTTSLTVTIVPKGNLPGAESVQTPGSDSQDLTDSPHNEFESATEVPPLRFEEVPMLDDKTLAQEPSAKEFTNTQVSRSISILMSTEYGSSTNIPRVVLEGTNRSFMDQFSKQIIEKVPSSEVKRIPFSSMIVKNYMFAELQRQLLGVLLDIFYNRDDLADFVLQEAQVALQAEVNSNMLSIDRKTAYLEFFQRILVMDNDKSVLTQPQVESIKRLTEILKDSVTREMKIETAKSKEINNNAAGLLSGNMKLKDWDEALSGRLADVEVDVKNLNGTQTILNERVGPEEFYTVVQGIPYSTQERIIMAKGEYVYQWLVVDQGLLSEWMKAVELSLVSSQADAQERAKEAKQLFVEDFQSIVIHGFLTLEHWWRTDPQKSEYSAGYNAEKTLPQRKVFWGKIFPNKKIVIPPTQNSLQEQLHALKKNTDSGRLKGETAPHPFQMRPDRQPLREPEQEKEKQKPVGKIGFLESPDSQLARPVGGIDFNPSKIEFQIKRDDRGVPLPLKNQNLDENHIKGLYPVIINILPVNSQTLPILTQLQ